ncbi:ALP1-like protein isoform X1 [Tanacetum coccineum]
MDLAPSFGVAGSNNDVNILRQSLVLNDLKVGKAPEVPFVANDMTYKWGYYLTDGIYPEWAVLMKSISQPGSNEEKGNAISPDFYPEEQHREDDPVRSTQDRLRVIREIHDEETYL